MNKQLKTLVELSADDSINIYFSGDVKSKENDKLFCNFFYYTKVVESDSILLTDNKENIAYLFIPRTDEMYIKWIGKRIDKVEASLKSGIPIEHIYFVDEFDDFLQKLLVTFEYKVVNFDYEKQIDLYNVNPLIEKIRKNFPHVNISSSHVLNTKLRLIKSNTEIDDLRIAIQVTQEGIEKLMQNAKSGGYEYQLQSYFEQTLKFHNCTNSFDTIMASGKNATCLHYSTNDTLMDKSDMVLFDLGARYNYMCADISRTIPLSGKFSEKQEVIYDIVLKVNKEMIELVRPGVKMSELNIIAREALAKELINIGLIKDLSEVSKYYYHSLGHQLGLLTHDLTLKDVTLEENMVITIEPGLYIEEWGIGVRIEDDILVTSNGYENLSKDIIKEKQDIIDFMNKN